MNEFDIIKQYFAAKSHQRPDVLVGIGDDAALTTIPANKYLVTTTDSLIVDVHFPRETTPYDIGYKSLAVNLSDLAAMGATPAWVTLALTLPKADPSWLQAFSAGFFSLLNDFNVQLIGGDLTHGPLSITVQAMGFVSAANMMLRKNAKPGDLIFVTGTIGDAGLALQCLQNNIKVNPDDQAFLLQRLNRPTPQVITGEKLLGHAHAAIDISDGLIADLNHILEQSQVGAQVFVDRIPLSSALIHSLSLEAAIELALTAGDDYELCFTLPENQQEILSSLPAQTTCIGVITKDPGLTLQYQDGKNYYGARAGYEHF